MPRRESPVLILTRPEVAARRTLRALGPLPVVPILSPLIRIAPIEGVAAPRDVRGLVLTSGNGVEAAVRLGLASELPAWCVGGGTAARARRAGWRAQSADGDADALVRLILDRRPAGPLLHIRGEHARGDVAERLCAGGVACRDLVAYRQEPLPLTEAARARLNGSAPVILPLYSPRTARILARSGEFSAQIHIVAMSEAVAEAARDLAARSTEIAPVPDNAAMAEAILRKIAALHPGPLESPDRTD